MSFGSININDFSFAITKEVEELYPLLESGKLVGRQVIHILSAEASIDISRNTSREELVQKIVDASFSLIKGCPEISRSQTSTLKEASAHFSEQKIRSLREANQAIINCLNSAKTTAFLKKAVKQTLEDQQKTLSILSENEQPSLDGTLSSKEKTTASTLSSRELREHLEKLKGLKEEFLEFAHQLLEQENSLGQLDPIEKVTCYDLWNSRDKLKTLQEKLTHYQGEAEKETLRTLIQAVEKIQQAPFLEQYETFYQLKNDLKKKIESEASSAVILSLTELLNKKNEIKAIMDKYPLEHVMGQLASEELKLYFFCMVKYQDEIQALAKIRSQNDLFAPDLNKQLLIELSELSEKTGPLKEISQETITFPPPIPSQAEIYSLLEAQNHLVEAKLLIESSKRDPETMTSIQELLWKSAFGFLQNAEPNQAREVLALATRYLPSPISLGFKNLDEHLQQEPQYGVYFSSLGTSYNKDQTIHLTQCLIDNKPIMVMDFSLNGHAVLSREAFKKAFDFPNTEKLMQILPDNFCSRVTVTERARHCYLDYSNKSFTTASEGYKMPDSPQTIVEFEGIGRVILGNCPSMKCIHNMVFVEAFPNGDPERTIANIQTMLTALGIPPVLVASRKSDQQIKALLDIFRAFYPREAALIERNGKTFESKPEELRAEILKIKPEMRNIFEHHLNRDLLPKKMIESITGKFTTFVNLSEEMRKNGAIGLMAGIEGSVKANAPTLSKILKAKKSGGRGALSSQIRFMRGIISIGQSSYSDHKEGGASGVFTRLITQEIAKSKNINDLAFHGSIQILFDLDAVNAPTTYGFEDDRYGTRSTGAYFSRLNMIELTKNLQRSSKQMFGKPIILEKYGTANEVIVRDSIGSQLIRGIVVGTQEDKQTIIHQLIADDILEEKDGIWYIGITPIDNFIKVSNKFNEDMWHD